MVRETTRRAGTTANPANYAQRFLARLGPLTLPYQLGTPASFDYTGFNGRALADDVMDVMLSLTPRISVSIGSMCSVRPGELLAKALILYGQVSYTLMRQLKAPEQRRRAGTLLGGGSLMGTPLLVDDLCDPLEQCRLRVDPRSRDMRSRGDLSDGEGLACAGQSLQHLIDAGESVATALFGRCSQTSGTVILHGSPPGRPSCGHHSGPLTKSHPH